MRSTFWSVGSGFDAEPDSPALVSIAWAVGGLIALQVGMALVAFFMSDPREILLYTGFLLSISEAATVAWLFLPIARADGRVSSIPGIPWVPTLFIVVTLGSAGFVILRQIGPGRLGTGPARTRRPRLFEVSRVSRVK